ncbi:MAG: HD domain-containing protein [Rudaea sp.]
MSKPSVYLSKNYAKAVDYARKQHEHQARKGSGIPYLYHLLGVSSLVLEYGGDEDQAIAALLHDVIEDCGEKHEKVIRKRFGDKVADIVLSCTDGSEESKAQAKTAEAKLANWRERKLAYLKHLRVEKDFALLVSCCDKLHNARAIVADLENPKVGRAVFDRFTAKRDGTLRYYQSVSEVFTRRKLPPAAALDSTVQRMHALAGVRARKRLE